MSESNVVPFLPKQQDPEIIVPSDEGQLPHLRVIHEIARVAHEAVCGVRAGFGQGDCPPWSDATPQERSMASHMVVTIMRRPHLASDQLHQDYINDMIAKGWTLGEMDVEAKRSPLLVPFDQLPVEQQVEDQVFRAVVLALYYGKEA
jgi:hypothetical protein